MKKTILLILAILPIVLIVVIAIAGRMLSLYQNIPVERVEFINGEGEPFGETHLVISQGETEAAAIRIYPELASNKNVTYSSSDESVCTVDANGNVKGEHYGSAVITVKTEDGNKMAMLNVRVTADYPVDVYFVSKGDLTQDLETLTLLTGEQYTLDVVVETTAALDQYKRVRFSSDNLAVVTVDPYTGKLLALSEGTATVTVTSEYNPTLTDTVTVVVEAGQLPLEFDFEGVDEINRPNADEPNLYTLSVRSIDLLSYLRVREDIDAADVRWEIRSGNQYATVENGVLTFRDSAPNFASAVIRVYVAGNPAYTLEAEIIYFPQN